MSTGDLTTSSRPTQSGKVVQLNGDCTSQITPPMSMCKLRLNTTLELDTFHSLSLRQNNCLLSMMSQTAMFAKDGAVHRNICDSLCPWSLLSSCIPLIYGEQSPVSTQLYTRGLASRLHIFPPQPQIESRSNTQNVYRRPEER